MSRHGCCFIVIPRRWPTLFRCERSESAPTMPPLIVNTQEIRKFVGLKAGPGDISVCWHDRPAALPLSVRKDLCGRGSLLDARKKAFITRRQVLFGDGATAVCHVGSAEGWDATDPWCSRDPGVDLSTNEGTPCGPGTLSVTASEVTGEEYKTAWASRRRSLLKRIRYVSAGGPAASAGDPWGNGLPRSRASAADEPRTGARRRPRPRPPGYPTPDARSRTGT
jgi:hypothetical protein